MRFETEAPVDDILVETEDGWLFVQAKTSLRLATAPGSELTKVAEQFVRQWLASYGGDGSRGWNRPLHPDRDRLLLALGPGASRTLSADLAHGLTALQSAGSAPLPQASASALQAFDALLGEAWKAATGRAAAPEELRAITSLISIQTFDFDTADRQLATELLVRVLDASAQASSALAVITDLCQQLMRQRTGFDMPELRRSLLAAHVPLTAPPSFSADVARLKAYSEHVRKQLREYEATTVAGLQVRIERQCTDVVVEAARAGSVLLVGEPGAGKSAVINASAGKMRAEGHDVLELAVDRLPVQSLPDLASELGLSHSVRDVLLNWPGDKPAFLFIDALDATRGGENEAVFRTLIADVLAFETRSWHVIASIRTFDLRLGEQFRRLFKGHPPNKEFADAAFHDVVHIHVPAWTPAELERLLQQAPQLATAIGAGGEKLRELALVPFNTRLLADLISSGLAPSAFGEIQSQVQLLGFYWNKRVEKHGTSAELCLRASVAQMVATRSLRARKLDAAQSDPAAFDALLRENVLVFLKQEQFVAFRHHILFDYAASRVYLHADDLAHTADLLTHGTGLGLMLAPALAFVLQQLWNEDPGSHQHFWDAIARFAGDATSDPVARSVAARMASELPCVAGDAVGALAGMSAQGDIKTRASTALGHVVGALVVRLEDGQAVSLDPWCELAQRASEHVQDTAWPLRALLYSLYERITSHAHRAQLGFAARKLLAYALDSDAAEQLTPSAIDFVAASYASDIDASRGLLRRLFEQEHFQKHADQELHWLARRLDPVSKVDPEFVTEIYAGAFGATISDESKTSLGSSQILPLSSNRRQDYDNTLWSLKQFFPKFLTAHPIHAVQALIQAISGFVARTHPISKDAKSWIIPIATGTVCLQEDHSYIWGWNVDEEHGDNALGLIRAFVKYFDAAEPMCARAMIDQIIARNELGVLWSRSLMAASRRPQAVGDLLWPIATQEPFLSSLDTRKDAIDFITARYPFEDFHARWRFESAVTMFKFQGTGRPQEARERILSTLFSCIDERYLATSSARTFLTGEGVGEKEAPPPEARNPRPFSIVSGSSSPEKWWWLKSEGVDLDTPEIVRILTEADGIKNSLDLEGRNSEITEISAAIDRVRTLIEMAESSRTDVPQSVTACAYGIAAQGLAKLTRQPTERLRQDNQTLPYLVELAIRLASAPVEPASVEDEARFESSASWGSPNAPVDTAEAVMNLCSTEGAVIDKLRPTIEVLLVAPKPEARMQVAERLTALWNSGRHLMWELAERVARTEPNRGVLRFFANHFLMRTLHADPERVEQLALILYGRDFNRVDDATRSLHEEIGTLLALLWISHGRDEPCRVLRSWIADPHTFEPELSHAIFVSRGALTLKYHTEGPRDADITRRGQQFCAWVVEAMADGLERYLSDVHGRAPTDAERDRGTLYAKLLNHICDQIYFASGAFRSGNREEAGLETIETKRAFLSDMRPVLARIAEVGTPGTIHHLIELLEFLVDADPPSVFDLVTQALLGGGRLHRYQFESLGADRFVEIIGHYLADHRELFADGQRRQKLVECLDIFMQAGWPAARRLLYRLPELLQ